MSIPAAQPGDICVIVEPAVRDLSRLRHLQQTLQLRYGGRPQARIHFTCQRFTPPQNGGLQHLMEELREQLSSLTPFPVTATSLEWAEHPFWLFNVLRWELAINGDLRRFGNTIEEALLAAGASLHYPRGEGWSPHVTALERLPQPVHPRSSSSSTFQYLYTGQRIVLSQVQPGKKFAILDTIDLLAPQVRRPLPHLAEKEPVFQPDKAPPA